MATVMHAKWYFEFSTAQTYSVTKTIIYIICVLVNTATAYNTHSRKCAYECMRTAQKYYVGCNELCELI
jgi:hypothetical protein